MAYLGVTPTQEFSSVAKQSVTGDGSVSYTLNKGVSDANDLAVFVNDVRQEPGIAYTATGNTITFTANLESTDDCYILHIGRTFSSAESPGIKDNATQKVLTITTDGHLVPTANVTYDLGTSDLRFRDIYLSGSSIELGDHSITANATHVSMGNVVTTSVNATDTFTLTSSANTSSAGPDLILYRDSESPNDGDYLGQIQFKGKNDNNGDEIYAKVTGKISDASLSTEDGLIETAIKGAGSFTIVSRQRSDELQLLNGVGLSVAGDTTLSSNVTVSETLTIAGDLVVNGNTTTIAANELKVEDSLIQLATNNEISDTIDIGFVGHYSNDGGTTALHTGFFRDASDEQYYLFNGYEDDTFDTATPPSTIDRTANTFTLASLNVGEFHSNYNSGDGVSVAGGSVTITRQSGFPNIFWDDGTDNLGAIYYDKTNGMRIFSTDGSTGNPERVRIDTSGSLRVMNGVDTSMTTSANGQFMVDGNGYTGAITLDGTAMYLYHNSSSRALVLATNETAQLTLLASGDVQVNRGKLYVHDSAGSTTNSLKLSYNATNGGAVIGPDSNGGSTYLSIGTSDSGTFTERMYISSTGNVGIGDGNPQEKLSVVGGILAATGTGSTSGITIDSTATAGYVSTITHTDTGMEFDTGAITRHFEFDGAGTNLWTLYTNTGNINQMYGSYRFAATSDGSDTGSQFQLWGTNGGPGYMAAYTLNFNTGGNNSRTTTMSIDNNGKISVANGLGFLDDEGGDSFVVYGGTTNGSGLLLHGNAAKILPVRNGASINATIDLGQDSRRFKDLYLYGRNYITDGTRTMIMGCWASQPRIETQNGTLVIHSFGAYDTTIQTNSTERLRINASGQIFTGPSSSISSSASSNEGTITSGSTFGSMIAGSSGGGGTFGSNFTLTSGNAPRIAHSHGTGYGASGVYFSWGSTYFYNTSGNVTTGGAPDLSMDIRQGGGNSTISNEIRHYDRSGNATKRDRIYRFVTTSTGGYVHMKTNKSWTSHTQMYSVHFEGQEYQASRAIDTTLSWYSYSPSNAAINIGSYGTHTASVYQSADGYLVMVLYANSTTYYSAFTVSLRTTAQNISTDFAVTAATQTTSATGAY